MAFLSIYFRVVTKSLAIGTTEELSPTTDGSGPNWSGNRFGVPHLEHQSPEIKAESFLRGERRFPGVDTD